MSDFTDEERHALSPRTRKSNPVFQFQSPHFKHVMLNDEEVEVKLAAAATTEDYDSDKSKTNAAARFFSTVRSNTSKKYVTIGAAALVLLLVLSAGAGNVTPSPPKRKSNDSLNRYDWPPDRSVFKTFHQPVFPYPDAM